MSRQSEKRKIVKGDYGYVRAERKRKVLITAVLLAVPLLIFFTALAYFHTRMTIWTVVAAVGCLPACKSLVNVIMLFRCPVMDGEVYRRINSRAGNLLMSYEMYMTFYEKSAFIDAFAICGNLVVGYSSDPKIDASFMETEAQKILKGNGYRATVKIFTELDPYLERLDSIYYQRKRSGTAFRQISGKTS